MQKAVQRLNEVALSIKTEVLPNAGDDLTIVQAQLINSKVPAFLIQK